MYVVGTFFYMICRRKIYVAIAIPKNAILSNRNKNDISCGDFIFLVFFILSAIIAAIKKMMPIMKRKSVIFIDSFHKTSILRIQCTSYVCKE